MFRKMVNYFTPLLLLISVWLMPPRSARAQGVPEGFNAGPDIITGDIGAIGALAEFGSNGTQVGLGVSTTSCNAGNVPVNFSALPATNHPLIPHNLYRMSGGAGNNDRFEQIGQSWVKHAFGADQQSVCFSCQPGGDFNHLGVGCSDTYSNDQNAEQDSLGSRALINPFTGAFLNTANNHSGHVHTSTSHRILVEGSDLNTALNPGATYYAEVQYISSDEYAWCQGHPGQRNMYNNASYLRYDVSGMTTFAFSPVGTVVRMLAAVHAWTGATINPIEPEPGVDGRAYIAYKVTGPVGGVYHYEYALYNENLDRAIQSFSIPLGCAITLSNLGFHAPPNHPGFPNDGTMGGLGFSNAPWTSSQTTDAVSWSTETIILNQNANAIRWGTLYNFRFDSTKAPIAANATIGFFKTGGPVTVAIMGPNACDGVPSPTPTPSATATPGATATPSATVTPGATATPSVTPGPAAQPLNLSTRMLVQSGDNVGIGGFIITGTVPKQVVVRAVGFADLIPVIPNPLVDPVLELHGPPGFVTVINDNCGDFLPPISPTFCTQGSLDSAIEATLAPGAYTAIIRGRNPTEGVGLVEVYDISQGVDSKLTNISTRAFVRRSEEVLIAGFILGGNNGNDRIIVRGIGPSLAALVPGAMPNPQIELRDSNGAFLQANNDWQDDPAQAAELTAAGLAPTNPSESGIAATLPPGMYTALLSPVFQGGVGVVEVYDRGAP
jgi:hypothetical protein